MAGDREKIDELTDELIASYVTVGAAVAAQLKRVVDERNASRRRRLARALRDAVAELKADLDAKAAAWAAEELKRVYELGAKSATEVLDKEFRWNSGHRDALKVIGDDTLENLLSATQHMSDDAKRIVRASAKKELLDKLIFGNTADKAGRELRDELISRGVTGAVYKNGAKVRIEDYAKMLIRTNSALAYNAGAFTVAKREGIKYMLCFDGPGCGLDGHDKGDEANGKIMPVEEAESYPLSHPNCRRSWSPLPDVETREQARELERAGTFKSTASQDDAVRKADAERKVERARVAARRRKQERRRQRAATA